MTMQDAYETVTTNQRLRLLTAKCAKPPSTPTGQWTTCNAYMGTETPVLTKE